MRGPIFTKWLDAVLTQDLAFPIRPVSFPSLLQFAVQSQLILLNNAECAITGLPVG